MVRSGSFKFLRIMVWPLAHVGVPLIHLFIHLLMYSFTKNTMICTKKMNSCPQGSVWIKVSGTVWVKLWVNQFSAPLVSFCEPGHIQRLESVCGLSCTLPYGPHFLLPLVPLNISIAYSLLPLPLALPIPNYQNFGGLPLSISESQFHTLKTGILVIDIPCAFIVCDST